MADSSPQLPDEIWGVIISRFSNIEGLAAILQLKGVSKSWYTHARIVEQSIVPDSTMVYTQHSTALDQFCVYRLKDPKPKDRHPVFTLQVPNLSKSSSEQFNMQLSKDRSVVYCITWGGQDVHAWRIPPACILPPEIKTAPQITTWLQTVPAQSPLEDYTLLAQAGFNNVLSTSGKVMFTADYSTPANVKAWNIGAFPPRLLYRFESPLGSDFTGSCISHDDRYLAVIGRVNILAVYDLTTGNQLEDIKIDESAVPGMTFTPDNEHVMWCTRQGAVLTVNIHTGKIIGMRPHGIIHERGLSNAHILSDLEHVLGIGMMGDVKLWNVGKADEMIPYSATRPPNVPAAIYTKDGCNRILLTPNEQILFIVTKSLELRVFHLKTGQVIVKDFLSEAKFAVATAVI